MAFNKSRIQIRLNAAIIGFILALCGQAYAFTGPSASDMPSVVEVEGRQVSLKNLSSPIAESEQTIKEGAEIYIKTAFSATVTCSMEKDFLVIVSFHVLLISCTLNPF